LPSPLYSARQQYWPVVAVLPPLAGSEVATPLPLSVLAPPIRVPPLGHAPPVNCEGLQRKKVTVPVGVTPPPDTVAVSVTLPVGAVDVVDAWVVICGRPFSTVKHSLESFV
jgi:hypothetical protein